MYTVQEIENVLVTAIESGMYGTFTFMAPGRGDDTRPTSILIADLINRGNRAYMKVREDYEGGDDLLHIDWYTLCDGIRQVERMRGYTCDNFDVIDADAAVQIAALGEITYG